MTNAGPCTFLSPEASGRTQTRPCGLLHTLLCAVITWTQSRASRPQSAGAPKACAHCHAAESAAAALGSRTGAAPNARRSSPRPHLRLLLLWTLYSRASPTSALLPKMSSHTAGSQFGTTRASALLKRRWTHLGRLICDSCSKGLSRQAPPPHAHGHSRRHTHPSAGALGVC